MTQDENGVGFSLSFFFFFFNAVFSVWDQKKKYCQMCKCKFNECLKKSLQINAKIFHRGVILIKKKKGEGEEEVAWNKQNFKLMGISFII